MSSAGIAMPMGFFFFFGEFDEFMNTTILEQDIYEHTPIGRIAGRSNSVTNALGQLNFRWPQFNTREPVHNIKVDTTFTLSMTLEALASPRMKLIRSLDGLESTISRNRVSGKLLWNTWL
jgi:hypothetical protein